METPPALPPSKPPLGRGFYITLLLPIFILAVAAACAAKAAEAAGALISIAGMASLVCGAIVASQLGPRFSKTDGGSIGMTLVMFFGVMCFYAVCAFAGCVAAISLA